MPGHRHRSPLRPLALLALLALPLAGCDKAQAFGDANSIIVAVPDSAWAELEPQVERALEPRAFTVRDERIFKVTQAAPTGDAWENLRKFQNILLIGEPGDPWIAEALEEVSGAVPAPPTIVQARNVWALDQRVTIALLPPGAGAEAAAPLLERIGAMYLESFQRYARQRMFVSGIDTVPADSLRREAGFRLVLPEVYYGERVGPGVYLYRNDYPDPSQLIRAVSVASRPSVEVPLTAEAALAWRDELARETTTPPQVTDPELVDARELQVGGNPAVEIQGLWSNPPGEWPAAGLFITRLVECPAQQRTFLIDTWLYAPGKDKYEYLVQLETILNTFECAG
jgi:hypothetical protein